MEKLKFALFSIVVLVLLGLATYWSISTIQSGTGYVKDQKMKQLEKENKDLETEVAKLTDQLSVLKSASEGSVSNVNKDPAPTAYKYQDLINELTPAPVVSKYQSLITELQKLVSSNVFLKLKSSGSQVGTVQKFLNIYNNTSSKVDNDYGVGTVNAVAAFQKDSGLPADGQAGPSTFSKMIDWLKNQK